MFARASCDSFPVIARFLVYSMHFWWLPGYPRISPALLLVVFVLVTHPITLQSERVLRSPWRKPLKVNRSITSIRLFGNLIGAEGAKSQ